MIRKKRTGFLVFLLGWLCSSAALAQQNPQYTQYIFNGLVINPAYAGSKEVTNVNALYRAQWIGLEGAPTTQTFSIDGSIKNGRFGIGFLAMNDQIGAQGQLSAYANAAVRLQLSENLRISFGAAGGIAQLSVNGTKLKTGSGFDPSIPDAKDVHTLPDAKAGLFLNSERFYAGLSVSNMIRFRNDYVITPARHYFLTTGYVFNLGEHVKFKPSVLVKDDFSGPTNIDLNGFILLNERIWLGASYRRGLNVFSRDISEDELNMENAWAAVAELYLTKKIRLGYAYDMTLTSLRNYSSHEVSLGYYFYKKQDARMLTPRYF